MLEGRKELECSVEEPTDNQLIEYTVSLREKGEDEIHSDEEFDNYETIQSKRTLMSVCVSDTEEDIETGGTTDVTIPESKKHPPPELSTGAKLPPTGKSGKSVKLWKRVPGFSILLILLSVIIGNASNVIVKELTVLEPACLLLYRSIITTSFAMPWAVAIDKAPFPPELRNMDKGLLMVRGFLGFINVIATIYSIRFMALGDQKMLTATRPVFVAISARVFLKEKAGWFTYVAMMFMLIGIVFVIKPPFIFGIEDEVEYDPRGMYSAIAVTIATILSSNNPVILRKLRKEHVISLSATNHLFFLLESFIFVMLFSIELYTPSWTDKLMLCLIAVGNFFAGLLYNLALKLDKDRFRIS